MNLISSRNFGFLVATVLVLVLITSAVVWISRWDRLPRRIRVATGEKHGLYHQVWEEIEPLLETELGREIDLVPTTGSVDNRKLLDPKSNEPVHLAMMQGDQLLVDQPEQDSKLCVIAPLYPEPLLVVASSDLEISSIKQLDGKKVYLGPVDSGSYNSAKELFDHFHIGVRDPELTEEHDSFLSPLVKQEVKAAVVVTGLQNKDVNDLLDAGNFNLLSIPESKGYAARSVQWKPYTIPEGFFSGEPNPRKPVETIATAGLVVANEDVSDRLVSATLKVIYEHNLQTKFANLIQRSDALDWCPIEPHSVSRGYFDPVDRLGSIAAMMESMAATKELLVAFGAGLFLLWRRAERLRRREREKVLQEEKDRLDVMLQQTLDIEKAQMRCSDPDELRQMLDQVTSIKLKALQELTDEELYADQAFSIFLMQCSSLISKIQLKIISLTSRQE